MKCSCLTTPVSECALTAAIGTHPVGSEVEAVSGSQRRRPALGDALRDEEAEVQILAEQETLKQRARAEAEQNAAHLCNRCIHHPVCAVASSIRLVGGEGLVVVSSCGAFATLGIETEPEPAEPK